ncbi:alpha-L-rhamnosidase [Agilicoccus flavus]|uniref:alpha-L-rhamnosidase n=1 Tax=Agilicoccus flavus TaxID=2775968 RepID=UPI001CF6B7A5|nr:alpha-L-rhamnosidase [Agilicoccus flavus]
MNRSNDGAFSSPRLGHLRVDDLREPLAIEPGRPRFGWHVLDPGGLGVRVSAHWIVVEEDRPAGADTGPTTDTGWIDGPGGVAERVPGFTAAEGRDYAWTVRVRLEDGPELEAQGRFGVGVTSASGGWSAPWLEPAQSPVVVEGPTGVGPELFAPREDTPPGERLHPPRYLRHRFTLRERPVRARLRVTSQGVQQPFLNGAPVGDEVLAPGYASYHHALPATTHDVGAALEAGDNVLGLVLGDGWWAGRISILGRSAQYGDRLRASWQLEVVYADGSSQTIVPGESVRSSRGPIDYSDLFIGERHDARAAIDGWAAAGFDDSDWEAVRVVDVPTPIVPFVGEPVRRVLELPVREVTHSPDGAAVVDIGQVVAGRMRLRVTGPAGTVVRLEHAEVVDRDGGFLRNIIGVNKDQVDEYVLRGDPDGETWEPLFTFHGFRYVRVVGWPGHLDPGDLVAVVLSSDLEQTGDFSGSDPRLDAIVANTRWSQRANFLAVPTDCPQRERAGWTGDLQIFAPTAATLMGVSAFLRRWFADLRAEQARRGGMVPIIVPMPPAMAPGVDDPATATDTPAPEPAPAPDAGGPALAGALTLIDGAAGWGDVVTMTPMALFERYADPGVLGDNLQAMRDWVDWQTREATRLLPGRVRAADLTPEERERHRILWNGALNFGDWLAPSTLAGDDDFLAMMRAPLTTHEIVGPCFQAHSLDLLARAEELAGDPGAAPDLRRRAADVRAAFTAEYVDDSGRLTTELQGTYVLALAFDMVPADLRPRLVERLVELVHAADDHLDTGFLSVPYLLDVLWDAGHADLARRLLRQDTIPSWLYEVDMGATTIWESWNAVHPDGSVDLVSMNHYAFGCVVDAMVRRLAGIDLVEPGYRVSRIAPDLDGFLDHCAAHVGTPYGRLAVSWERRGDSAVVRLEVPTSTVARLELPDGWSAQDDRRDVGPGRHEIEARRHEAGAPR